MKKMFMKNYMEKQTSKGGGTNLESFRKGKKLVGKPYLSIVVTARNDDYGHRFLYRVQKFLDNLVYLCEKYKLSSEVLFIDWNPPKETKRLWDALDFPKTRKYLRIRFIEVPNKIHKTFKDSDKWPLFEYIGKNVGINRSNGEFVLTTNPDIIFNEELIEFISKKKLDTRNFYRISRYDVPIDIPENIRAPKVITFCKKNWEEKLGTFFRNPNFKKIRLGNVKYVAIRQGLNIGRLLLMLFGKNSSHLWYHGGAPGDFILMTKKAWQKFDGFPELPMPSVGVDGYGVICAVASGLKMKSIKPPCRIYHQFHERPFSEKIKFDYNKYLKDVNTMLKEKRVININDDKWGLRGMKLPEKSF